MLVFLPLDPDLAPLPGGGLQIGGRLPAASPNQSPPHLVEARALQSAAASFTKTAPTLGEMFRPGGGIGDVDGIKVSRDGALCVTATVTDAAAIRKVDAGVLKALAIAVRVLARDPSDPNLIIRAEIIGASLVDRPDDAFGTLAKADTGSAAYAGLMHRLGEMGDALLDLGARLLPYEPASRTGPRRSA